MKYHDIHEILSECGIFSNQLVKCKFKKYCNCVWSALQYKLTTKLITTINSNLMVEG